MKTLILTLALQLSGNEPSFNVYSSETRIVEAHPHCRQNDPSIDYEVSTRLICLPKGFISSDLIYKGGFE